MLAGLSFVFSKYGKLWNKTGHGSAVIPTQIHVNTETMILNFVTAFWRCYIRIIQVSYRSFYFLNKAL